MFQNGFSFRIVNIDYNQWFVLLFVALKVANILLNGVRYDSDLSEHVETADSQMSMKLLCVAIYRMPPSLRSLCTNHFLGKLALVSLLVGVCLLRAIFPLTPH